MAGLVLLVGLPGAGKTTWAKRLEDERKALRFTPDEWMQPLFDTNDADGRRWVLESQLFWNLAARALTLDVNVILDYGCWSAEERHLFRTRAQSLGATAEMVVLDIPFDTLWSRIAARNANLPPGTFAISHADLTEWTTRYEPPTPEELMTWDHHQLIRE
ncbi:AAA family ATPase [Kribbella sp. NPDC048915]|uniref:AAA family ATPase n=1 Tax=Kribbella sp. NPDC048915 TaxID=3155148 RepID=UPI003410723B